MKFSHRISFIAVVLLCAATLNVVNVGLAQMVGVGGAVTQGFALLASISGNGTPDFYLPTGASNQDQHQVKASTGQLYSYHFSSTATYPAYAKFYDKASGACTSSDTPKWVAIIPSNANGAGNNFNDTQGIAFASGICVRFTQGQANNDTTAVTSGFITSSIAYY